MNMIKLRFIVSIAAVVALSVKLCFSACARAEYEVNGECCPMCAPGNHVNWDCSIDTSTTCVPCPASTYSDEPSSSSKCFSCSVCEQGQGLRVKRTCTRSADTVCEPLNGFYCIERNKESCRFTVRHSECSPGQYIIQAGSSIDTVCADCTGDTYSDGSFSSCLPHTKCEDMGLTETNQGTYSSDTECGNPHTAVAIIALSVAVTLILSVFAVILILKKKQSQNSVVAGRKNIEADRLEEQAPFRLDPHEAVFMSEVHQLPQEKPLETN